MTQEALRMALEALERFEGNKKLWPEAITAIKKALAQTQEPDYWLGFGLQAHTEKPFENATPLYTTPPQRTWVGLTDEEVRDLWSWSATSEAEKTANTQQHAFARAIEAKLKQKNGYAEENT